MCEIIAMTRSQAAVRREATPGQSAEILFFTGVRYARMPEPDVGAAVRGSPAKTRRVSKRDTAKRA